MRNRLSGRLEVQFESGFMTRRVEAESSAPITTLWIHGLGESGLCFENLMRRPELAGYRHVAVDLRGYGRSPWDPQPTSLEDHARRLQDWIEEPSHNEPKRSAWVAERLMVVGHSMGGVIGTYLCESLVGSGVQILGFVNVEGNISLADCNYSSRIDAYSLKDFEMTGYGELLTDLHQQGRCDRAHRSYHVSASLCDPSVMHLNSVELVAASRGETLAARFASLRAAKLYLHGGGPGGTGARSQALLRAAGIEPVAVGVSGHWPFIDEEDDFVDTLTSFLDGVSAKTGKA